MPANRSQQQVPLLPLSTTTTTSSTSTSSSKHLFLFLIILLFILFVTIQIAIVQYFSMQNTSSADSSQKEISDHSTKVEQQLQSLQQKVDHLQSRISNYTNTPIYPIVKPPPSPLYNHVHIFYYMWYGNPKFDNGNFLHWNHMVLPHWQANVNQRYPQINSHFQPIPLNDIGSNFYPMRGLYSSRDAQLRADQFSSLADKAHVYVLVISWWGQTTIDHQNELQHKDAKIEPYDTMVEGLIKQCEQMNIKVVFHLEPYKGRTAQSTKLDLQYIVDKYGHSPALLKMKKSSLLPNSASNTVKKEEEEAELPLIYLYDSYLVDAKDWNQVFNPSLSTSIRNTKHDCIILGLYLDNMKSEREILESHFDGFYTYFAAKGFTYGSTITNWNSIANFAAKNNLIFVPSVGPGYIDDRIRPWNGENTRSRDGGRYYEEMFGKAIDLVKQGNLKLVSITSYNEWHEGTQIEEAIPQKNSNPDKPFEYLNYEPHTPTHYLDLTRKFVDEFVTTLQEHIKR